MFRICMFMLLVSGMAARVEAHAHLVSSQPSAGSTVAAPPAELTLVFSELAKVTSLTIQGDGDKSPRKLPVSTAEDSLSHAVALPTLAAGDYIVAWHALSDDGHVTSGTVRFSVRSGASGASGATKN
jgi:methionine-rich copper-binding protein CopC